MEFFFLSEDFYFFPPNIIYCAFIEFVLGKVILGTLSAPEFFSAFVVPVLLFFPIVLSVRTVAKARCDAE